MKLGKKSNFLIIYIGFFLLPIILLLNEKNIPQVTIVHLKLFFGAQLIILIILIYNVSTAMFTNVKNRLENASNFGWDRNSLGETFAKGTSMVCRLVCSLCSLQQSPQWTGDRQMCVVPLLFYDPWGKGHSDILFRPRSFLVQKVVYEPRF